MTDALDMARRANADLISRSNVVPIPIRIASGGAVIPLFRQRSGEARAFASELSSALREVGRGRLTESEARRRLHQLDFTEASIGRVIDFARRRAARGQP